MKVIELTEEQLQEQISKLQIKRAKDLANSLKKIKPKYVYDVLLNIPKGQFHAKLKNGKFAPEEVAILIKHQLIKL